MKCSNAIALFMVVALVSSSLLVQARANLFTNPLPESNVNIYGYVRQNPEYTSLNWQFSLVSNRNLTFHEYLNISVVCNDLLVFWYQIRNDTLFPHSSKCTENLTLSYYTYYGLEKIPMIEYFAALHSVSISVTWIDNCSTCLSENWDIIVSAPVWLGGNSFYHEANATITYRDYGPTEPPYNPPLGGYYNVDWQFNVIVAAVTIVALIAVGIDRRQKKKCKKK